MTPSHLAAVRAACQRVLDADAKATAGPWKTNHDHLPAYLEPTQPVGNNVIICEFDKIEDAFNVPDKERVANAALMVLSRNLSPALARAVLNALDKLAALRQVPMMITTADEIIAAICAAFPEEIL